MLKLSRKDALVRGVEKEKKDTERNSGCVARVEVERTRTPSRQDHQPPDDADVIHEHQLLHVLPIG
jgi:hypothetical protein